HISFWRAPASKASVASSPPANSLQTACGLPFIFRADLRRLQFSRLLSVSPQRYLDDSDAPFTRDRKERPTSARALHRRTNMQLRRGSRYWMALMVLSTSSAAARAQGFGLNEISTCGLGRGYSAVATGCHDA